MSEKVLISRELFSQLIQYHFFDKVEFEDDIKRSLEIKLNDLVKRENYTKYLDETDPQKKQEFFNKYLAAKDKF